MDENLVNINYFEPGYPKKIYYPHYTEPRFYYDNGTIVSIVTQKIQLFKYIKNSQEYKDFKKKTKNLKKNIIGKEISI